MVKILAGDLKGFKLVLTNGKETYQLGTLGAEAIAPKDTKKPDNKLVLHLTAGNTYAGEVVGELPGDRVLMLKGSIYSRNSALSTESRKVGSLG